MEKFRAVDLIIKKRNGNELTTEEINFFIDGYVDGSIPAYQMSALLMSIYYKGLNKREIVDLTNNIINSGDILDLSEVPGIKLDKHSTGGVGDKITIALAPLVSHLGGVVSKMSGRGLGFTGGTIDKLESIPGMRMDLSIEEFISNLKKHKVAIIGQTKNIAPADKMLYSLRDVSGTSDQIGLIFSSIMGKKVATGADAILFDIKCGNGAFMSTFEKADELAKMMINIGKEFNKQVWVVISNMNIPLGKAVGNKLEVIEALETLKGNGPKDFEELLISKAALMLVQGKVYDDIKKATKVVTETVKTGAAVNKFYSWVEAQGGDLNKLEFKPKYTEKILSPKNGYMHIKTAIDIGILAMKLGAGRLRKEDSIDFEAGIYIDKQNAEKVAKDDVVMTLYSSSPIDEELIKDAYNSFDIINEPKEQTMILKEYINE